MVIILDYNYKGSDFQHEHVFSIYPRMKSRRYVQFSGLSGHRADRSDRGRPELSTLEVVRISSPSIKVILFHFLQIFKIVLFVTSSTINTVPSITRWNIESICIRNPASINWFRIFRAFLKTKINFPKLKFRKF